MRKGSARDYLGDFRHLIEVKEYHRIMTTEATKYYLNNILKDMSLDICN